jgi:phenylalanyl-tRNA synthetase beta chain
VRISLNWVAELLEGVEASALRDRADELASRLTFAGLEVERVERIGVNLDQVVAARIAEVAAHPKADRLSVVQVEAGGERLQVVSGATNFKPGDLAPLAKVGTRLPAGKLIEAAVLRGVSSQGMLCSEAELGVSDDAGGIWILPAGLAPGQPIGHALALTDVVFDVNVTPNRGDCLSHLGIARELGALLGWSLARSRDEEPALSRDLGGFPVPPPPRIDQPDRCARYEGQLIVGHAALDGPSPFAWRYRLNACGVRPIGLAVDATSYVLLELGQPLHAFDSKKVTGGITVRLAAGGERLVTLDGIERKLEAQDLCICDGAGGKRPIALAGVMGGATTAVGEGTRAIYLEAAHFAPRGVRLTARRHAIESEAAHRFSRGVDPLLPSRARRRAVDLLTSVGANAGPWAVADGVLPPAPRVALHFHRVEQLLGERVSPEESRHCLQVLGIAPAGPLDDVQGTYLIPSHRPDLELEVDLVAEVGRLRGLERLPGRPPARAPDPLPQDGRQRALRSLREALRGLGFAETIHLGFLHDPAAAAFGGSEAVRVVNPLTVDASFMRRSLLPSLLQTARRNLSHLTQDAGVQPPLRLFEVARTYRWPQASERPEGPALEPLGLGLLLYGSRQPLGWSAPRESVDYYDLRGVLQRVLQALSTDAEVRRVDHPGLHPRSQSGLFIGERELGRLGELHPAVAETSGLPRGVFVAEIELEPLLTPREFVPRSVPRFPAVLRDVALVVDNSVSAAALENVLRRAGGELLESLTCFDVYRGPPLDPASKSMAYSLRFRATDRTLTDAEVAQRHAAMVEEAGRVLAAKLR